MVLGLLADGETLTVGLFGRDTYPLHSHRFYFSIIFGFTFAVLAFLSALSDNKLNMWIQNHIVMSFFIKSVIISFQFTK